MTARPPDGPLTWNVAGLLADVAGSLRDLDVALVRIDLPDDLVLAEPIAGHVKLTRTNRGVLATARVSAVIATECSRCLRPTRVPLDVVIDEEYLPTIDLSTGRPVPVDADDDDALRLSDHHELDLETPVAEGLVMAMPIAPLDRVDCPGLCIVCGEPMDEGVHDHPDDAIDPRLEALRGFQPDRE